VSGAPLEGLRVFDLSQVIAGPLCTRMLADLGADVIRVETADGDLMRGLPIAFEGDLSTAFAQYNVGKRSVGLDLKSDAGRDVALRLAGWADVVVENFRPGTLERLGLGYGALRAHNDDVILCSLSTFGATGPYAGKSGFGLLAEAYSGLMSLAGEEGGPPTHFGTPLADMNSAVHAVAAIGAALFRRERTGAGTHIDISMYDSLYAMIDQAPALGEFTGGERNQGKYGTRHASTVPSGVAAAADGRYIAYGAPGDRMFARVAQALGRPGLTADERFATVEARIANATALYELIEAWAATVPSAEALVERLQVAGVTAAVVRTVEDNRADPHLVARGTLRPFPLDGREVLLQSAPLRFSGCEVPPAAPAPHVGEHTNEVLRDVLGLGAAERDELFATRAVHGYDRDDIRSNDG
jgi:crotonobetainyl-CoA:carnitine CoA-transferase CaiB-like acyl-CoA transferase